MATTIVTDESPTTGTVIKNTDNVFVTAYTATGTFSRVIVTVVFPGLRVTEVIYNGTTFTEAYATRSVVTSVVSGTHGNGLQFACARADGWPDSPSIVVYDIDSAGAVAPIVVFSWLVAQENALPVVYTLPQFTTPSFPDPETNDSIVYNQQYFLDLFSRFLESDYIEQLKNSPNSGYEIFQAAAIVGERISQAVNHLEQASILNYAHLGDYAEGVVEFYRLDSSYGAVTVGKGTVVTTSSGGRDFVTLTDAVFGAVVLGPIAVAVRAVAQGWEWNLPGQRTYSNGQITQGSIDTIKTIVQVDAQGNATFVDPSIKVQQISDTSGGKAPTLEGYARNKNIFAQGGESEDALRARVLQVPDTISPDAFSRALTTFFGRFPGANFELVETFDPDFQTAYDAPMESNVFTFDDPRVASPLLNVLLDEIIENGCTFVVVPALQCVSEYGLVCDDPAINTEDFNTDYGVRCVSAFDLPFELPGVLQCAIDGEDLGIQGTYAAVYDTMQTIKAQGTAVILWLEGT